MATEIYKTSIIELLDGTEIELKPLKIKHLRKVMIEFENIKDAKDDEESMTILAKCVYFCLQQLCPDKSKTFEEVEDNVNMPIIHEIMDFCTGIKLSPTEADEEIKQQVKDEGSSWKDLDLVKIESEVFILGIWKDFEELESNLSMPELVNILSTKRELDYEEKKFLAALQGVDLDKSNKSSGQNAWEEMKARVFSRGATSDPNDILSLQGVTAKKKGFGIGFGLDYDNRLPTNQDSV